MKFTVLLLLVLCFATLTLACSKKCHAKKKAAALQQQCSEIAGGTKIKLEIDIAGGGCRGGPSKRKKPARGGKNGGQDVDDAGDDAGDDEQAEDDQDATEEPPASSDAAPAPAEVPPAAAPK